MTTVGYGNKCAKSVPARLFSFVWVVIGIVAFSLVTAILTSKMFQVESTQLRSMDGSRVGVFRDYLYETMVVAHQGGKIIVVEGINVMDTIHKMLSMLKTNQIEGFALDKSIYQTVDRIHLECKI